LRSGDEVYDHDSQIIRVKAREMHAELNRQARDGHRRAGYGLSRRMLSDGKHPSRSVKGDHFVGVLDEAPTSSFADWTRTAPAQGDRRDTPEAATVRRLRITPH